MIKKILIALGVVVAVVAIIIGVSLKTRTTIHVEHTLNAPAEKVWRMWNDPEIIVKWWGPMNYSCPVAKNDPSVGGKYFLGMKAPDGTVNYNVGTYTEVVPMKKMVSKLAFADESGNQVPASKYGIPGNWPDEVQVTIEFEEADGKTLVKITEEGIPSIMKIFAKMGWDQQFEKFDALIAAP